MTLKFKPIARSTPMCLLVI